MEKRTFIAAAAVALLLVNWAGADVSMVLNGSFENDERSIDYITPEDAPRDWNDVELPETKFGGALWGDWSSHGDYYVTIYSYDYGVFSPNDTGTISQQVYLEDVNEIIFDVKLDTTFGAWDPQMRTAVLLIDGAVVWESNSVGPDVRGEYLDQIYTVEGQYKDPNLHDLSVGLRADSSAPPDTEYYAMWDFIKFDTYCGGLGSLPADLNHDCYVDMNDLQILAEQWLADWPDYLYDLHPDSGVTVNFYDFAVFTDYWGLTSHWSHRAEGNFLEPEFEYLTGDFNGDYIVEYDDLLILVADWLAAGQADLDDSGIIDFVDFAMFSEQWLHRNWLYGWN